MTIQEEKADPICIGVLTPDSLRLDGLRLLLQTEGKYRIVPLAEADRNCPGPMSIAMLDVASAVHLESLVKQLRRARPQVNLLVLGPDLALEGIMQIVRFGARGYLPYSASEQELRLALEVVQDGSIWAPRKVLGRLLAQTSGESTNQVDITRREEEVLQLLVQGCPNRQIAEALGLDEATVKAHLGRLMRKLGVRNRTALSMQALSRQVVGDVDDMVTSSGYESL